MSEQIKDGGTVVEYFAADPAGGEFSTYKTLPEARAAAEVSLGYAQDDACEDGWADEPPQICYGIVLGHCIEREGSRKPAPEGSDFSEMIDFRLTEPCTPPASTAGVADVPQEWKSLLANLAAVVRVQNGNKYDDINALLDSADRLLAAREAKS